MSLLLAALVLCAWAQEWAIQLAPGTQAVDFAKHHNLSYRGAVGQLPDYHLFVGNFSTKTRSVSWAEQQIKRRHVLRQSGGDPLFSAQWHLHNYNQDVGVQAQDAWNMGVVGTGVTIAIVDDGLQSTHPDLHANFAAVHSWDFNGNHGANPGPTSVDAHGTACAGVCCGVRNNNVCGSGVCPECRVAGLRLIADAVSDVDEANALAYHTADVQIYSNSWGPIDDGKRLEGPGHLTQLTFEQQTRLGRGGKGTIYVWAAGNGAKSGDNCNYDGYANNMYTIAIGAVDSNGYRSYYSEPCSALMAVAPSSGARGITTTDLTGADGYSSGNCTSNFGGTSSAAPLAAGIIGLLLSAHPHFTWRDIQHVIAKGATKVNINHYSYSAANARGFVHSHEYGFGNLVVPPLLQAANQHVLVPAQRVLCEGPEIAVNKAVPLRVGFACPTLAGFVEHVQITIRWRHSCRGKTVFTLTSVSGQKSWLSTPHADCTGGVTEWTFGSVAHWGESIINGWTLDASDDSGSYGTRILGAKLKIWGY